MTSQETHPADMITIILRAIALVADFGAQQQPPRAMGLFMPSAGTLIVHAQRVEVISDEVARIDAVIQTLQAARAAAVADRDRAEAAGSN